MLELQILRRISPSKHFGCGLRFFGESFTDARFLNSIQTRRLEMWDIYLGIMLSLAISGLAFLLAFRIGQRLSQRTDDLLS